jgi:hypothetical protein
MAKPTTTLGAGGTAVALDSRGLAHENHACAEPQACHTNETSAPVPPDRWSSGATGVLDAVATDDSMTPAPSVVVPSVQTCGMPKRPLGHGEASDAYPVPPVGRFGATCAVALTPSAPTPTPTSIQTGSASEIVSDGASLELLEAQHNQSDSRGPHDCTHTASGEPSLRGAHSRTPAHEYSTLKESSPPQTSGPPSSDSGP